MATLSRSIILLVLSCSFIPHAAAGDCREEDDTAACAASMARQEKAEREAVGTAIREATERLRAEYAPRVHSPSERKRCEKLFAAIVEQRLTMLDLYTQSNYMDVLSKVCSTG
jgi:hypothetical protein